MTSNLVKNVSIFGVVSLIVGILMGLLINGSIKPMSLITNVMNDCDDTIIPQKVFRINVLDPIVGNGSISGNVTFAEPHLNPDGSINESAETTEDNNQQSTTQQADVYYKGPNYPFHVDLNYGKAGVINGEYAMIRIVLPPGDNYSFYDKIINKKYIHGVGVGLDPNETLFCMKEKGYYSNEDIKNHFRTVIFYEKAGIPPPYSGNPASKEMEEPFNIIITAKNANDTPVVIDPKSHQPGSQ